MSLGTLTSQVSILVTFFMTDRLDEIISRRAEKANALRAQGVDPYPATTQRSHSIANVISDFDALQEQTITIAGRLRSQRGMGKLVFGHVDDGTGRMQVLVKEDVVGAALFAWWADVVDVGDVLEVVGTIFVTKTGEKTLQASGFRMLTKAIRPIPAEYYGLENEEARLRKRYLDILLNSEVKDIFVKKNIFWQTVRTFLADRGFLEVQTPVLEHTPGGADAEPFITHHNALSQDFYLRISLELPLKRLLVAGYEKVFEIGRLFRNEGMDRDHLQEYDDTEFYWAYADHEDGMQLVEELFKLIVQNVTGGMVTHYEGHELDWSRPWPRVDYFELFQEHAGIDLNTATVEQLREKAAELGSGDVASLGKGRLIDLVYKRTVRPKLIDPCFLVGHPIDISPLSKTDPSNPNKVLRMQVLAAGSELGNGWAELNDGVEQRRRFDEQMKLRADGDKEAQMLDEDFVEALEYGMPPAFGFGMSERVFAVLMDKSIRETVIFPSMREARPSETGKAKESKIAVAVINEGASLEEWQRLNTVAHLNASFAARLGKQLFLQDEIATEDGQRIKLNIQHAIMLKSGESSSSLAKLAQTAKEQGLEVSEFTREMIETTDDRKVIELTKKKNLSDVEYLGVLVFGKKSLVDSLTKEFPLHK